MHSLNLIHLSFHDSTSLDKATREEPPSLDATLAAIFMPTVRSLISLPSSDSISPLTRSSTSAALTNPLSDSFIGNASFISSTNKILLS
ncbi:hypothetical protein OIU77_021620, partial [Salix suchowensis]